MPRILIIGERGQLAQSLARLDWPAGCDLSFRGRRSFEQGHGVGAVRDLLRSTRAHLVLNAAAYTAVDMAESEPEAALALNAGLPAVLAAACRDLDLPLVHVSTDYVFDGAKRRPYTEADAPNPLNRYGATKLAGDRNIEQAALRRWAILRASWLVSEIGETFPVKLLRRARSGERLRVVDDQQGCPTAASDLARAMQVMGLNLLEGAQNAAGLFNFCGASEMSWHGLADRILAAAEAQGLKRPPLDAISSAELRTPARRPAYSVLSPERLQQACGISGMAIESDLDGMVSRILAA